MVTTGSAVPAPPAAPTGLTGRLDGSRVLLTWDDLGAAHSYRVSVDGTVVASPQTAGATLSAPIGVSRTYAVAVVDAWGQAGPAASVTVTPPGSTVPGAPGTVTAVPADGQALVSWSAAAANGSPVTGYTVLASPGGTTVTTSGATTATLTGLTNGTPYTVTVTATNAVGTGPASAPVPVTAAGRPGAPGSVMATPGDRSATVSWSQPPANGSRISTYTVTASPGGARATSAGTPSAVVTGLTNGTAYTFAVTATNAAGTSPASAPSAAVTPTTGDPIGDAWRATGGAAGPLGRATGPQSCGLPGGGCSQTFADGEIVWSAGTGAQIIRGAILQRWRATGGAVGGLGLPVTSDARTPEGAGYVVHFQGGSVYWSASTGAHDVRGAIAAKYRATGGPAVLGFPVGDDSRDRLPGAFYSNFQSGDIVWSAATGAQVVRGAIRDRWLATGASVGGLGLPTSSDARLADGGYLVDFQRGSIYWSASTGAHDVRGAILAEYRAAGGPGYLGYPVGNDSPDRVPGVWYSNFQSGDVVWSAGTGAQVVRGAILAKWIATGASGGVLGLPVSSDAVAPGGGGYVVHFQRGSVYWSPGTGAHWVAAAVDAAYRAAGGTTSSYGYPSSDTYPIPGGQRVDFQNGQLIR